MSSNRPIRVLQVVTSVAAGGLARYVLDLMANVDRARCEMHLACTHFEGPHFEEARAVAATTTVFAARSQFEKLSRLSRLMRTLRPDVVHAHQEPAALIAARLARIPKRIETVHLAKYWLTDGLPIIRMMSRRATTAHIVYTEAEKAILGSEVDPQRIAVVNPGLDTSRWKEYWSRSNVPLPNCCLISADAFVIGTVARLDEQKGIRHLLNACPEILKRCPSAQFLIVGDGALRRELEQQCLDLGITDRVIFTGYQLDAYRYLGAMNVFVMPSLFESWGFTAIEAMWAGLPVICSRIPGPTEFITNEQTGILIDVADPGAIAEAVVRLWIDPEFGRTLASAGEAYARERCSINTMVMKYLNVYSGKPA